MYQFLGGTFHQDFDIYGDTLEEVMSVYRKRENLEYRVATKGEIERFIAERPSDQQLNEDVQTYFEPDVLPIGWDPAITNWRQSLARVAELCTSPMQ